MLYDFFLGPEETKVMDKEKEIYWPDYLLALGYKSGRQSESKVQQICYFL